MTVAFQLHYTSCLHGITGYAGFQTQTQSEGLSEGDRREVEGRLGYTPPRGLPREPDAATLQECFPRAFRVLSLASGHTALVRSEYLGQDYSSRWGNFFAHAVVFEGGLGDRWPIDAYAWPGWVGQGQDLEGQEAPPPLPSVPLENLTAGRDFSFEELQTFLCEMPDRVGRLAEMIRAVFRRSVDSRSLVIRERLEMDGVYWLACVQKAFPPCCQQDLTCSTFQFDPVSALALNATMGETDFRFDGTERDHQFYVFDFVTDQHSPVQETLLGYAEVMSAWMATDPERIEAFHRFAGRFDTLSLGPDLLHILRLFRLSNGESLPLAEPEAEALMVFVKARPIGDLFPTLLTALGEVRRWLPGTVKAWCAALRLLLEGAVRTGEARHGRQVCLAWIDAFDRFIVEDQADEASILALREEIERAAPGQAFVLAQAFLADDHLDGLLKRASRLPPRGLGIVFAELERSCRSLGQEPTWEAREVLSFIEAVLYHDPRAAADLQWAFVFFRSQPEGLAKITEHGAAVLAEQAQVGQWDSGRLGAAFAGLGQSLATALAAGGEAVRYKVLERLKARDALQDVLFSEWAAALGRASDKVEAHAQYGQALFTGASRFASQMPGRTAEALLAQLTPVRQRRQAKLWVETGQCQALPVDTNLRVLALACQEVSLIPEDGPSERLARRIMEELDTRGLTLPTNRLELRAAVCRASTTLDGLQGLSGILRLAEDPLYEEFLVCMLPRILDRVGQPEMLRRVLHAVTDKTRLPILAKAYGAILEQRPGLPLGPSEAAALCFWPGEAEGTLRQAALDALSRRVAALPPGLRKSIQAQVEHQAGPLTPKRREALGRFLAAAEASRPSLVNRLFGRIRK